MILSSSSLILWLIYFKFFPYLVQLPLGREWVSRLLKSDNYDYYKLTRKKIDVVCNAEVGSDKISKSIRSKLY